MSLVAESKSQREYCKCSRDTTFSLQQTHPGLQTRSYTGTGTWQAPAPKRSCVFSWCPSFLFMSLVFVVLGGCLRAGFGDGRKLCGLTVDCAENLQRVGLSFPHGVGLGHIQCVFVSSCPNRFRSVSTPQFHGGADGCTHLCVNELTGRRRTRKI